MKQENVDGLYGKLGKAVPKSKRESLKASLAKADDSKYEGINKIELTSKSPIKGISGLTCFFATLLGMIFLACNLIAFLYVTPTYTGYSNYAAKLSDDLSAYYAKIADYGSVGVDEVEDEGDGEAAKPVLAYMYANGEYKALKEDYDNLYKELLEKEEDYNGKFDKYSEEVVYVGNKTANYLNLKVQLAELTEPEEGIENYEKLKEQYDTKKAELEEKIADYEAREAGLSTVYDELTEAHTAYDTAATALSEAVQKLTEWQSAIEKCAEYKASLYAVYQGGTAGIIAYMDSCNAELTARLEDYNTAISAYDKAVDKLNKLPSQITEDEDSLTTVAANYQEAKGDLNAYIAKVTAYREEYENYLADNAQNLEKHNKISAALDGVMYTTVDGNRKIEKDADKIVESAKKLLEDSAFGTLLNGALDVANDDEMPQAVKDTLAISESWLAEYDETKAEYLNNLSNYDAVLVMLNLTAADEDTVEIYQEILNASSTWTVDYYVTYCQNNKEDEDFAAKKSAFEVIQNAESSIGNSQKIKLISDKFDLSAAAKDKYQSENDGIVAYYSVEQLSTRLQTALNIAYEQLSELDDYYEEINSSIRLQWLYKSDKTTEKVHKKLAYDSHVQVLENAMKIVKAKDFKEYLLDEFDVTAIANVGGLVEESKFSAQIKAYTDLATDVEKFGSDAKTAANDYMFAPGLIGDLVMIFDIILIATYAAYFVYSICNGISIAKKENYEKIERELAE